MTRRNLLEASLASSIMAALHPELAEGATGTSGVLVGNGVDRWGTPIAPSGYPWVKVSTRDTGGAWSAFESPVSPQAGVPLHVHHRQEEWFYTLEGKFLFEVGGHRNTMTAGMSLLGPRGVPHRFKNIGESTGRILILCQPAGLMEECSVAISRMPQAERSNPDKMKALLAQYDIEVIGPPLP
jgi:mannose-6-phosphate isomerase-like protein (cupin superfamily)